MQVVRQSRLFETAPELVTEQPIFLNAAVAVKTDQPPLQLLSTLKAIEARSMHWVRSHMHLINSDS